mmetsp:Transcript_2282/g.5043  ORF Transcript_2282/g.5043 Transcript_2282/m.5043 type:complete len:310 (-) Transcript_2282:196-1125(-)
MANQISPCELCFWTSSHVYFTTDWAPPDVFPGVAAALPPACLPALVCFAFSFCCAACRASVPGQAASGCWLLDEAGTHLPTATRLPSTATVAALTQAALPVRAAPPRAQLHATATKQRGTAFARCTPCTFALSNTSLAKTTAIPVSTPIWHASTTSCWSSYVPSKAHAKEVDSTAERNGRSLQFSAVLMIRHCKRDPAILVVSHIWATWASVSNVSPAVEASTQATRISEQAWNTRDTTPYPHRLSNRMVTDWAPRPGLPVAPDAPRTAAWTTRSLPVRASPTTARRHPARVPQPKAAPTPGAPPSVAW